MRGFEDMPIDWAPADVWLNEHAMCCQSLRFIAPGVPKPKGNVIKGRWGGYHDATEGLDDWLGIVRDQACAAMRGRWRIDPKVAGRTIVGLQLFNGPVALDITFVLPRPKTFTPPKFLEGDRALWRTMFTDGIPPHLKKIDVDKCIRAVGDALTGIVWHDDSQVVDARGRKRYAYPDETTGAIISVTSDVRVT